MSTRGCLMVTHAIHHSNCYREGETGALVKMIGNGLVVLGIDEGEDGVRSLTEDEKGYMQSLGIPYRPDLL